MLHYRDMCLSAWNVLRVCYLAHATKILCKNASMHAWSLQFFEPMIDFCLYFACLFIPAGSVHKREFQTYLGLYCRCVAVSHWLLLRCALHSKYFYTSRDMLFKLETCFAMYIIIICVLECTDITEQILPIYYSFCE